MNIPLHSLPLSPVAKPVFKQSTPLQRFRDAPAVQPAIESLPLVEALPLQQCKVCVIVPVRNEAENLESTLQALANQVDLNGRRIDPNCYEVIVFANNCTDESAAIARQFAQQQPAFVQHIVERTLSAKEAYIGRVRQLLMDEAYRRFTEIGNPRGIIASTDGDTQVSPTWIAATMHEIENGADAVGGRIVTHKRDRAQLDAYARACFLREVGYRYLIAELESYLDPELHDPFPRHFQHYGASLAVTAEMYIKSGGMPAVRTPEDVAFYRALMRADARFRHSPLVRVTTSARQIGRAEVGLAKQLQAWQKMGQQRQPFLVEPAVAVLTRMQARRRLRLLWQRIQQGHLMILNDANEDIKFLANLLDVTISWLIQEAYQARNFGQLFDRLEQQLNSRLRQRWAMVPIELANEELRFYRKRYCQATGT
ncbi:glycosyltransferase family 2 protein [Phormidium tenue FACHB-886]|nr:glycosyltransferase family 2 protein [Phormidium tenue FACHB-886]